MAFFRRAILEASGGEVRWSKSAVAALKAVVEAKVHRTLALGSTLARVAKKKTLNDGHLDVATAIIRELGSQ